MDLFMILARRLIRNQLFYREISALRNCHVPVLAGRRRLRREGPNDNVWKAICKRNSISRGEPKGKALVPRRRDWCYVRQDPHH